MTLRSYGALGGGSGLGTGGGYDGARGEDAKDLEEEDDASRLGLFVGDGGTKDAEVGGLCS